MSIEFFLFGLLFASVITSLVTEAVKKILTEHNMIYRANTLAGAVAVGVSAVIGVCYLIATGSGFNATIFVYLLALVLLSWLCAMVGYDKVIQAISQFKTTKKGD